MTVDDIIALRRKHPIDVLSGDWTPTQAISVLLMWGVGMYATMYLSRWFTIRRLEEMGVVPRQGEKIREVIREVPVTREMVAR